jgi:hypothetical protein
MQRFDVERGNAQRLAAQTGLVIETAEQPGVRRFALSLVDTLAAGAVLGLAVALCVASFWATSELADQGAALLFLGLVGCVLFGACLLVPVMKWRARVTVSAQLMSILGLISFLALSLAWMLLLIAASA